VRASAGTASFRRRERLADFLAQARQQVEAAKTAADDPERSARKQAARERAVRQRQERLERALEELDKLETLRAAQTREFPGHPSKQLADS
jgi:hypothetical protein